MKKGDKILIICIIVMLIIAITIIISGILLGRGEKKIAVVTQDGNEILELPLETDTKESIIVGDYKNEIVVSDGYVYMKEANCPDLICVNKGKIRNVGDSIVCLPHKLVISIRIEQ